MYRITFTLSGPHVGRGVCPATCAAKVVRGILVADCIGIRFKYIVDRVEMLIQCANVRQTNVYLSYNHP